MLEGVEGVYKGAGDFFRNAKKTCKRSNGAVFGTDKRKTPTLKK